MHSHTHSQGDFSQENWSQCVRDEMKVSHGAKKLNVKVKEQKNGDLDFGNEW